MKHHLLINLRLPDAYLVLSYLIATVKIAIEIRSIKFWRAINKSCVTLDEFHFIMINEIKDLRIIIFKKSILEKKKHYQ